MTPETRAAWRQHRITWITVPPAVAAFVAVAETGNGQTLSGLLVIATIIAAYCLPTFIAWRRHHPRLVQVGVIDLLTGWTLIGWVVALVIAVGPLPSEPAK